MRKLYTVVVVVGLFLSSISTVASQTTNSGNRPFLAGVNIFFTVHDYESRIDLLRKLVDLDVYLRDLNVNAVSLVWPIYTEGVAGNTVFPGPNTPSNESIYLISNYFTSQGYHVTWRPTIDETSILADGRTEWRGTIRPRNIDRWFSSYTSLLIDYANIASRANVDVFTIAVELTSMHVYPTRWRHVIAAVREVYDGELTYASNRGISTLMPWDALDFISVDAFFDLPVSTDATVEEMVNAFAERRAELTETAARFGLPLVFAEVGTTSQYGSFRRPWVWNHNTVVDQEAQALYYRANCMAWRDVLDGLYWWHLSLVPLADPATDGGFSPQGKLAEDEIKTCFQVVMN